MRLVGRTRAVLAVVLPARGARPAPLAQVRRAGVLLRGARGGGRGAAARWRVREDRGGLLVERRRRGGQGVRLAAVDLVVRAVGRGRGGRGGSADLEKRAAKVSVRCHALWKTSVGWLGAQWWADATHAIFGGLCVEQGKEHVAVAVALCGVGSEDLVHAGCSALIVAEED